MLVGDNLSLDHRLVVISFLEMEGLPCGGVSGDGTECSGERGFVEVVVLLVHGRKMNNIRIYKIHLLIKVVNRWKKTIVKRKFHARCVFG